MVALVIGAVLVIAAILACLPGVLGWWQDVLAFLRGFVPVMAVLVGMIAIFIGIADLKDRREAKEEEREEAKVDSGAGKKPE